MYNVYIIVNLFSPKYVSYASLKIELHQFEDIFPK